LKRIRFLLLCSALLAGVLSPVALVGASPARVVGNFGGGKMGERAGRKAQEIRDEKESRTPAQQKIDSQLLYAIKQRRGETQGIPVEPIELDLDAKGRALVDITAKVTTRLISKIRKLGGSVISKSETYQTVRARMKPEKLEALAAAADVRFIAPAYEPMNNNAPAGN
jgi:hypothetical protein